MKNILKPLVPKVFLRALKKRRLKALLADWESKGCPSPPPHIVKQLAIRDYQKKYGHQVLVETGTYLGDMVEAQKENFKKIISIELGEELYKSAVEKFKSDKNVLIIHGDSGKVMPSALKDVHEPAIFWLDGHYSAGVTALGDKKCPIFEEIDGIFNTSNENHILLIDDARCFKGEGDYPTVAELTAYVKTKNSKYECEVKHDIIRFTLSN